MAMLLLGYLLTSGLVLRFQVENTSTGTLRTPLLGTSVAGTGCLQCLVAGTLYSQAISSMSTIRVEFAGMLG